MFDRCYGDLEPVGRHSSRSPLCARLAEGEFQAVEIARKEEEEERRRTLKQNLPPAPSEVPAAAGGQSWWSWRPWGSWWTKAE